MVRMKILLHESLCVLAKATACAQFKAAVEYKPLTIPCRDTRVETQLLEAGKAFEELSREQENFPFRY